MYYIKIDNQISVFKCTRAEAVKKVRKYRKLFKDTDVQIVNEKYVRKGKEK
jgi:hypothetical protein